ncbi:MAG: radical SAM protein [Planctomycetia bacterium]|nr:radical SAM protein [Planctomycetia bacterium]
MDILRAKTTGLLQVGTLTNEQRENTLLNQEEMRNGARSLKSLPQRLVLELTNACNLRCIMCGRDEANFTLTTLPFETIKKLAPLLNKVEEVTLFGWGEPTMHPQFHEILEFLNEFPVRKYFVTNGMRLDKIQNDLFDCRVDIMAISLDGCTSATNDRIRVRSNLDFIVEQLKSIVRMKREKGVPYPYMNFVMTMMESNIDELPGLVRLAAEIGLEEVKGVYLTAFSPDLLHETLHNQRDRVEKCFGEATKIAEELGIKIKLPYLQGDDVAGEQYHKNCYVAWRDFFIGADGFVRPCQSIPRTFFKFESAEHFEQLWNSEEFQNFRACVNEECMCNECKRCYQSSHANWNRESAFIQIGEEFAPTWIK